jgi:hypothetical protein
MLKIYIRARNGNFAIKAYLKRTCNFTPSGGSPL